MKDTLQQYMEIREALRREKEQLEQRLQEINKALGLTAPPAETSQPRGGRRGRRGRAEGGRSLRDLVMQVTSQRALSKQEILDEVQRLGYQFNSKNPANSLGVILYGKNPRFQNEGGRFRFTGEVPSGESRGKRQMSAEARERIRAAAKARWEKARAAGRKRL
ncbi:MAG TPA: hypothetical protein VEH27_17765 [Methylomirabilota bacterium]|nr:hypothetical protein [Methylomirabilota bacterium]